MNAGSIHRTRSAGRCRRARSSLLWLSLMAAALAQAEPQQGATQTGVRATRNVGHRAAANNREEGSVAEGTLMLGPGLVVSGDRVMPIGTESKSSDAESAGGAVRRPALLTMNDVWFYSTESTLRVDADRDGYFHAFSIAFDAELRYGDAQVYAQLYLSLEGGPWNHYATTEVFTLEAAGPADGYVVDTSLELGYPRGHYDVLIELYEAYDQTLIASAGPEESYALTALPLEDAGRDRVDTQGSGHGGGGGLGLAGLLSLAGIGLRRRLGSR